VIDYIRQDHEIKEERME